MTVPVYKIETYTGAVLDYTITKDALNIQFKETLTDAVGSFSFTVPTKKNGDYYYDDIALHDKVKIYLGYDAAPATPNFIGRITTITAPLSTQRGFIRLISGLSQGEILLRRQKTNKHWASTGASTIVTDIANDLSLGTADIASETIQEDIEVDTETYFDLLQRTSDYWKDGANQVKYDFYVDVDNDLVWKTRPIRTVGVETLTVGDNIVHYAVMQDVSPTKNNITVYGVAKKTNPSNSDGWTEATTGWTSDGTLSAVTDNQIGTYSVKTQKTSTQNVYLDRDITQFSCRWMKEYKTVNFWWKVTDSVTSPSYWVLHIYAPDNSNYFLYGVTLPTKDQWHHFTAGIGPDTPYGYYRGTVGSPSWEQLDYLHFYMAGPTNRDLEFFLDAFHFGNARFSGTANDATSQSTYGQRDLEVIDNRLTTDTMCQQRAEKLLYQLKDPPTYITVTTPGNTNILVGDRLTMTIPAENISAVNYDVYEVTQMFDAQQGFMTKALMINSGEKRISPVANSSDAMVKLHNALKHLEKGERMIY